jgi:uncharacterized protein (DUF2236 family)
MSFQLIRRAQVEPAEDYGFFGPDSVTWKVWSYPTSLAIGFSRAVSIEQLDPALVAAVDDAGGVRARTRTRYDRTLHYFALVMFGDSATATRAANVLVKVHAKAVGTEPLSGNRYDANDPASQLWIHLTAWHSILKAYERYGPGPLSDAEERRYWEECAIAAELQTCSPGDVPRTRDGVRAYFESMRPKLAGSEAAQSMLDYVLGADYALPELPRGFGWLTWLLYRAHRMAILATYPRWMRRMAGLRQGPIADALIVVPMRLLYRALAALRPALPTVLSGISPSTVPVVAPVFLGVPPRNRRVVSPAEARERLEILAPRLEYERFRALVEARRAAGARTEAELGVGPDVPESLALIGPTA